MPKLLTVCENCIFNHEGVFCEIGKPTYTEEEFMVIDGYCRHKRSKRWAEKITQGEYIDQKDALNHIQNEESGISLILDCSSSSDILVDVKKLTDNLPEDIIEIIVIITKKPSKDVMAIMFDMLNLTNRRWSVDMVIYDNLGDGDMITHATRLCKEQWIYPVSMEYPLDLDVINEWKKNVSHSHIENYVAVSTGVENNVYTIMHTRAFQALSGNNHDTFISKVMDFENWQLCLI